jgi:hypothetical protein
MASWPLSPVMWRGVGPLNPTRSASLGSSLQAAARQTPQCRIFDARAKRLDEAHAPLCATNRWAASTTVLSRSGTANTGARADSARASCCPSNRAVSIPPSSSKASTAKVLRTTHRGPRSAGSTTKSAMRSTVARSGGFHGGKVQDRVVGDPTAVGVTELRAQRSRMDELHRVSRLRQYNHGQKHFDQALSRRSSLCDQTAWLAVSRHRQHALLLQVRDASVRMTAIGRAAQLIHQRTRRRPIGPRL